VQTGWPIKETLIGLGLPEVAQDLAQREKPGKEEEK